jgi:hypothetical protein
MRLFNTPEHISMYLSLAALKATPMKHVYMSRPLLRWSTQAVYSYQKEESRALHLTHKSSAPILPSQLH